MGAPKKQPSDAARSLLRQARLRCTPARVAVLEHIRAVGGPRTHAEVADALADCGFDRATIYRNLTELTEAKIFSRVELGDHVWRFEVKRAGGHGAAGEDHPHFLCTTCGEISCLDDVRVAITPKSRPRTTASAARGARATRIHSVTEVLLKGRCESCG